jgi:hypothetical protein
LWLEGDREVDHLGHAACNLMFAIHLTAVDKDTNPEELRPCVKEGLRP